MNFIIHIPICIIYHYDFSFILDPCHNEIIHLNIRKKKVLFKWCLPALMRLLLIFILMGRLTHACITLCRRDTYAWQHFSNHVYIYMYRRDTVCADTMSEHFSNHVYTYMLLNYEWAKRTKFLSTVIYKLMK